MPNISDYILEEYYKNVYPNDLNTKRITIPNKYEEYAGKYTYITIARMVTFEHDAKKALKVLHQQATKQHKPKEIKGLTHSAFNSILTLLANGENVLLNGPSGTGKNVLGNQIAEALGLEFYCTPAIRQEYKLSGFIDANGNFVETPFYKAWTKGGVYLFDEMDASDATVILNINSALANGYYEFPIGLKKKHKDFYILGAGNTLGNGGDRIYTAREELDASTIDRFAVVPFGYDEKLERELAGNEDIYKFITAVRKAIDETGLRYVVSMRATKSLAQLYGKMDIQELVKYVVCRNMRTADIKTILSRCKCPVDNPFYIALKNID